MSYPQQPGNWPDQSWPAPNQPYSDPGYAGYPGYPASAAPVDPGYPASAAPVDPGYGYGYGYGPPVAVKRTNGLAIAAMVTSLASVLTCLLAPVGIVGAIMGHVARRQIRERGEDGDGMALTGIIVGWIIFALSVIAVLGFIAISIFAAESANTY